MNVQMAIRFLQEGSRVTEGTCIYCLNGGTLLMFNEIGLRTWIKTDIQSLPNVQYRLYEEPKSELIFTTVGVYANWKMLGTSGYVMNGVTEKNLESHIEYNKTFRPGRALFVDGKCYHKGYLLDSDVQEWIGKLDNPKFKLTKNTEPYK